jgi:uncharacterized caspase-like protein
VVFHFLDTVKEQEIRKAIIIGINKYESDPEIPRLAGAENDAIEIRDRLIKYGNFEIPKNHYLIGSDATRRNILKAVSEVFRKDNQSDLVTFYFSGHGIVDEANNEGYIAPYDMDPEDPFVYGINMDDLKKVIYKSKNKSSVIIILDCCYAGIVTKDTKSLTNQEHQNTKNLYAGYLKNIVNSEYNPDLQQDITGQGKIILASSEPTTVSREKNNCIHIDGDNPHTHGAFSFHLIEGLDGKAADRDTGIITIENIRKYIESQMTLEGKQKPMYYIAEASNIENIKIAVSQKQFNKKISFLIEAAENFCAIKDSATELIDIQGIDNAAKKVNELINLDPNNKEIPRLQAIIDDALNMYKQYAIEWINNNTMVARLKINEIQPDFYDIELPNLIYNLSYNELQKMDQSNLLILIHLSSEVRRKTKFETPEDRMLKILIDKLRGALYTNRGSKQITGGKI